MTLIYVGPTSPYRQYLDKTFGNNCPIFGPTLWTPIGGTICQKDSTVKPFSKKKKNGWKQYLFKKNKELFWLCCGAVSSTKIGKWSLEIKSWATLKSVLNTKEVRFWFLSGTVWWKWYVWGAKVAALIFSVWFCLNCGFSIVWNNYVWLKK